MRARSKDVLLRGLALASVVIAACAGGISSPGPAATAVASASTAVAPASPSAILDATSELAAGRLVFHAAAAGDRTQLFVMGVDGSDQRQITEVDGEAAHPAWSPKGDRIAFAIAASQECSSSIAFVDPDGTNLVVLPHDLGVCETDPAYTPDGAGVVFQRTDPRTGDDGLWRMRVDGTGRVKIGAGFGAAWAPEVSPDGTTVSAVGWNLKEGADQYEGLFTMGINGSSPRWLTPNWNPFRHHDWSPDGEWIALTDNLEDHSRSTNTVAVRRDGTDLRPLTHYERPDQRAVVQSYSPDGEWILYRLREHDPWVWALFLMRADGSEVRRITPFSSFFPDDIDWGPAVRP